MTQVQLSTAASNFSPSPLSTQSHKISVQPLCAIACTNTGPHIKNPDQWQSHYCLDTQKHHCLDAQKYHCLNTLNTCLDTHKYHYLNTSNTIVWTYTNPIVWTHQIPLFGHTKYHCLDTPNTIVWTQKYHCLDTKYHCLDTPNTTVWTQKYYCLDTPNTIVWTHRNTIVWTHQIPLFGHTEIPLFGHTKYHCLDTQKYHCLDTPNTIVWAHRNTIVWTQKYHCLDTQKYHCLDTPNTIVWTQKYHCLNTSDTTDWTHRSAAHISQPSKADCGCPSGRTIDSSYVHNSFPKNGCLGTTSLKRGTKRRVRSWHCTLFQCIINNVKIVWINSNSACATIFQHALFHYQSLSLSDYCFCHVWTVSQPNLITTNPVWHESKMTLGH